MAPSIRGLALLSADALIVHAVYVFVAGTTAIGYGMVISDPPLVISLIVAAVFVALYYVVYRIVGMLPAPRPPNPIREPDSTAPFEIPYLSNTGDNEDFESIKKWSQYMTGKDASGAIGLPIIALLFIVTATVWSVPALLSLGIVPSVAAVIYYVLVFPVLPGLVVLFSSIITGFWIAERLVHQYGKIYPDSHTRPLDVSDE